jgi:lysophospholipase L1-like esterase
MKILDTQSFQTPYIIWRGRHHHDEIGTNFYYTASGFNVKFQGSRLITLIESNYEEDHKKAYLTIEICSKHHSSSFILPLKLGMHTYTLFDGPYDSYDLKVFKRSEELMSSTKLMSLETDGTFQQQAALEKLSIEFIGDSLTCGYGNMSNDVNQPFDTKDEDGLKSFASIAAKKIDADYEIIAVSGIGLYKSIYAKETLPAIYQNRSVHDHHIFKQPKKFDWIVIMLGTNDNAYMKLLMKQSSKYEKTMFEKHYQTFLNHMRLKQPSANFLCLYQKERQNLIYEHIIKAVVESKDEHCYVLELPEIELNDGMGAQYHPTIRTHEKWGLIVAQYIKEKDENIHT